MLKPNIQNQMKNHPIHAKCRVLLTIHDMDDLKQSVQNAAYEQKDPLLIYKFESFELFKTMMETINKHVVSMLLKAHIHNAEPKVQNAPAPRKLDLSRLNMNKSEAPSALGGGNPQANREQRVQPIRIEKKVGRNEPCPCGSGKKYKNCHGAGLES